MKDRHITATQIRIEREVWNARWLSVESSMSKWIDSFWKRMETILARYDEAGWPTRDAAAPEEDG